MKKYFGAAAAFALAATLMTGCGCTNQNNDGMITDPTTVSTTAATMPSSDTTPIATTDPVVTTESHVTTDTTVETTTHNAGDTTTGTHETTDGTHESTGEGAVGRARRAIERTLK